MAEESAALPDYIGQECSWYDLSCNLSSFGMWLLDVVLWVPRKVFEILVDALLAALQGLGAGTGITAAVDAAVAASSFMALPEMLFVATLFQLSAGFQLCLASTLLRFGIRRLPIIG